MWEFFLKGSVRKQWGKLSGDDVDKIVGKYEQLVGRVLERYGVAFSRSQEYSTDKLAARVAGSRSNNTAIFLFVLCVP